MRRVSGDGAGVMHFFPNSPSVKTTLADGDEKKSELETESLRCRFVAGCPPPSCLLYLQNYFATRVLPHVSQRPPPPTSSTADQTLNLNAERIYMLKGCNLTGTSWRLWLNLSSGLPPLSCWGAVISPAMERDKLPPTNTWNFSKFLHLNGPEGRVRKGVLPEREIHSTLSKGIPQRNLVRLRRTDDWKLSPEELTVKAEHSWTGKKKRKFGSGFCQLRVM